MGEKKLEFKYPFEPPWEDLKREVEASNGVKCRIFDSCVADGREERAAADRRVAELLARSERRRFMKGLEADGRDNT